MLPQSWSSERLRYAALCADQALSAKAVFDSNVHLQCNDPTFREWPLDEFSRLISSDATGLMRTSERRFYLRGIYNLAGDMLGYFQLEIDAPTFGRCWLPMLVLRPDAQSIGYGTETFESILCRLREIGNVTDIGLNVYAENPQALIFWFRRGFREVLDVSSEEAIGQRYTCITLRRPIDVQCNVAT